MREAKSMMQKCQHVSMRDGGISFTEEGFTILYNECLNDLKVMRESSTIRGVIIGGATVGLISVGIYGISKFRKHKFKKNEKLSREQLERMGIKTVLAYGVDNEPGELH